MKKLMIGILVIIPLIVMLTVGLISRYVSQKVHIGVDSVSFSTDTLSVNLSDFTQDADGNFTIDLAALLDPQVLPSHAAAANSLEWSIEDVEPTADELGGIPAATLPDASKGTVVVSTYCSFFVTAQAEQASARCYVEVTDKEVQSVTLYSPSGSVAVGGSVKLTPQYTPLNSIVTQGSWSTGDPSVATVDANGVVTGKAAGSAVITFVTHTDGGAKEVRATYTITVTAAATVFGNKFHSHLPDIALSDILAPGVSAEGASAAGGSISGGRLWLDSDECTVTLASGETFTVIRCEKDDITILNKDIFAYDPEADDPFVVATDEIPLDLDAVYLSAFRAGETPAGVSWQLISGEGIASLSADGVVTASATGSMTVRVTAAGGASDEIELVSVAKVAALRLAMTESSLAVGLARETVFATREYDANGELTASGVDVTLLAPVLAEDATAEETAAHYGSLEFEVAPGDADKAYFGGTYGNRLIFNPEAVTERTTVTFTVSAKYPKYPGLASSTSRTLTVNVVPGVAVYDEGDWQAATVAQSSADEAVYSLIPAIVLMADLDLFDSKYIEKSIWCDIYGNNHALRSKSEYMPSDNTTLLHLRASGLLLSNLILTPISDIPDNMSDEDKVENKIHGRALRFVGKERGASDDSGGNYSSADIEAGKRPTGLRVEYCIIQNASEGVQIRGEDVDFVGTIFRNIGYNGIAILCIQDAGNPDIINYAHVGVHNCVFSNILLMPIYSDYNGYGIGEARKAVVDEELKKPRLEQRNCTLTQTGFMDVYNWKDLDKSFPLLMGLADDLGTFEGFEGAFDVLNSYVMGQLLDPTFNHIIKRRDGFKYVHFGMMSLGAKAHSYWDVQFEEDRWAEIDTNMMPAIEAIAGLLDKANTGIDIKADPIRIWCYKNTETGIDAGVELVVNSDLIDRMHAE